jgi:hypothetical protein
LANTAAAGWVGWHILDNNRGLDFLVADSALPDLFSRYLVGRAVAKDDPVIDRHIAQRCHLAVDCICGQRPHAE